MIGRMMSSLIIPIILIITVIVSESRCIDTCDAEIDRILKKLNKPALKSINSPDGDIIDCVHMKNHPIYDNSLFKNHTIQMKPSSYPKRWNNKSSDTEKQSMLTQLWKINGRCPKNSIPIRRTRREDILRAESIERYGKQDPDNIYRSKQANSTNTIKHEYAIYRLDHPGARYYGGKADISVWKPYIQTPREFSLAQMWVSAGPESQTNSIETGWQVYPHRYGDDNPRLFIYWTNDSYRTGCYNLNCPGFVPTNQEIVLGGTFGQISSIDGQQILYTTTIWQDARSRNWWLKWGNQVIGYWPSSLFTHLQNGATGIDFGGEIVNLKSGSQHTTTSMGSGRFAQEGLKKASFFGNLEIVDENRIWKKPPQIYDPLDMTNQFCYNIKDGIDVSGNTYFFYGGPGRNRNCP